MSTGETPPPDGDSPIEEGGPTGDDDSINQDELDALLAELSGGDHAGSDAGDDAPVDAPVEPPETGAETSPDGEQPTDEEARPPVGDLSDVEGGEDAAAVDAVTQDEINRLLSDAQADESIDASALDDLIEAAEGMDEALAEHTQPDDAQAAEPPPGEEQTAGSVDQGDIDELISAITSDEPGAEPAGEPGEEQEDGLERQVRKAAEEDVGSENLAAAAAPETVDSVPEESLVSQDMLEELLASARETQGTPEAAPAAKEPPGKESAGQQKAEKESAAEVSGEELAEELSGLGLGVEGDKPAPGEEAIEDESLEDLDRQGPRLPAMPVLPTKLVVAVTAGILCATWTFVFLITHQERPVDLEALSPESPEAAQEAISAAQREIAEGKYKEAQEDIAEVIPRLPEGKPRQDAAYTAVEAAYKALPEKPSEYDAQTVHMAIDDVLEADPWHPRAAEARGWKADIYERTGILNAARDEYETILSEYPSAPHLDEILIRAAKLAMRMDRPKEAADHLDRFLQQFPGAQEAGEARVMLGEALAASGKRAEGERLLRQVARANRDNALGARAYESLGRLAFEAGRYDEAIELLETRWRTALTSEGNDGLYLMLAKAYRATGRLSEAERVLRELMDFFPMSDRLPEAFIELSSTLDDLGERKEATRLASQAAARYPDNPAVLKHRADLLKLSGYDRESAESLLAASRKGYGDPRLLLAAGELFRQAGAFKEARAAYEELLERFSGSRESLDATIGLSAVLRQQGKPREALKQLEDLAETTEGSPRRLPVLIALGHAYAELGLTERAGEIFEQVAVVTTEPEVLAQAAMALLDAGSESQGLAVAQRVDVSRLSDPLAYKLLMSQGESLLRVDASRAVEKMEQAYEQYPAERTDEGDQALLDAYLATDRNARARILVYNLDAEVRRNPADLPVLQRAAATWGDYLYEQRDFRGAVEAYELAAAPQGASSPYYKWARYQLANAFLQLEDYDKSLALLDEIAVGKSPWSEEASAKAEYARLEQRLRAGPGAAGSAGS